MANTLKFGNGEWYGKKDTILAYNDENKNYKPLPFDFSRGSSATVVNKDGLIQTVGSGEPRIDYKDDSKGALLLEPTRTNYVLLSNDFSSLTGNGFVTSNYGTSPEGLSVSRVLFTGVGQLIGASTSLGNGVVCNFSAYVKGVQGEFIKFAAGGVDIAHTFSGEWERLSGSATSINNSWNLNTYGGATARDFLMCAAQLEQGSYPTSYIPTQGGAVTRLAESCTNGGNEQVFNDSEGTFFVNFAADFNIYGSGLTDRGISINNGTNINSARIFQATSLNNRIAYDLDTSSGTNQVFNTSTTFVDITDFNKVAFTYKQNEFKIFLNGVQQGSTDTNGSVFSDGTLKGISFDYGQEGNKPFFGRVKEVKYFNSALTDQQLQALTTI